MMVMLFCVIIVNLGIGVVSRILVENILNLKDFYLEIVFFKVLVIVLNIFVIGFFVGKKMLFI